MNLIPTELNQRLASAVWYSASADRFYISGKAGFWRLVDLGLVTFAVGVAAGFGFYGYSYITQNSDALNVLSSTFSKALAEVHEIAPEPTGHGLPLSKCEAYNRVYEQPYGSS
jgi:hypothetical protein